MARPETGFRPARTEIARFERMHGYRGRLKNRGFGVADDIEIFDLAPPAAQSAIDV